MTEPTPRFKVGDIINSSLSSPKRVINIRLGRDEDFRGRYCNWTGSPCYILQSVGGRQIMVVYSVRAVDSDFHLKGSEMYEAYESIRNES